MRSIKEIFEIALARYEAEAKEMDLLANGTAIVPFMCFTLEDLRNENRITPEEYEKMTRTIRGWINWQVTLRLHLRILKKPNTRADCLNFYREKMKELTEHER